MQDGYRTLAIVLFGLFIILGFNLQQTVREKDVLESRIKIIEAYNDSLELELNDVSLKWKEHFNKNCKYIKIEEK